MTHSEDMTEPEPGTSQASPPHYRCVAALLPGQHTLGLIPRAQHICEQGNNVSTFIGYNCTGGLVTRWCTKLGVGVPGVACAECP